MARTYDPKGAIRVRAATLLALLLVIVSFAKARSQVSDVKSVEENGGYIRSKGNTKVLVFMHGLYSGPEAWKCDEDHYWPEMIAKDESPVLSLYDIYVAKYTTPPRGGTMTFSDLASNIYNQLRSDHIFDKHNEVVFVAHSMGGILTQQLLITFVNEKLSAKVTALLLYGTPQEGSSLANIASLFRRDPLVRELQSGEGNFILPDMNQKWLHGPTKDIKRYCAYETKKESGVKVVGRNSATSGCNDIIAIDSNHRDLVKPCTTRNSSYEFLLNTLSDIPQTVPQATPIFQAQVPAPTTPPFTPYEQAREIINSLNMIIGRYGSAMQQVEQQYASPYKHGMAGQLGPMNGVLPDNLFREAVDIDHQSSESYRDVRTRIISLRQLTQKCFQPTPNQLAKDEESFSAGDAKALTSIPLEQLRNLHSGGQGRFIEIKDYVTSLQSRLADARCGMY